MKTKIFDNKQIKIVGKTIALLIFVLAICQNLSGLLYLNEICYYHVSQCQKENTETIGGNVVSGAISLLNSSSNFQALMAEIEKSENSTHDFSNMKDAIEKAISEIASANAHYKNAWTISKTFNYDAAKIGVLKTFDYNGFGNTNSLDIPIYGDVRYDLAKLSHSILGLYDFIIAGYYDVDISKRILRAMIHVFIPPTVSLRVMLLIHL